uniref:Uncharacterized protein n=1 Tax=Anopheles atroparvus TaxID=41427 RepID=A0AAG5CXM7_ANOAO
MHKPEVNEDQPNLLAFLWKGALHPGIGIKKFPILLLNHSSFKGKNLCPQDCSQRRDALHRNRNSQRSGNFSLVREHYGNFAEITSDR